ADPPSHPHHHVHPKPAPRSAPDATSTAVGLDESEAAVDAALGPQGACHQTRRISTTVLRCLPPRRPSRNTSSSRRNTAIPPPGMSGGLADEPCARAPHSRP